MRFQERDAQILWMIHNFDGVVAKRHLKSCYWHGKSTRVMQSRLAKLFQSGFISWPTPGHRKTHPIPEPICWLGWRGALYVAGQYGIRVEYPAHMNENQLRLLQSRLNKQGFRWVREPRWSLLSHDLTVIDFRLAILKATAQPSTLVLNQWITESTFRSKMDVVHLKIGSRLIKKGICPDAYFEINDMSRKTKRLSFKAMFLLELDMATHSNPSFGREKILPGIAYLRSKAYRTRFGSNSGRWLIVTSNEKRMRNLMEQTAKKAGQDSNLFFFTTQEQATAKSASVLTSSIWWQVGMKQPSSLFQSS